MRVRSSKTHSDISAVDIEEDQGGEKRRSAIASLHKVSPFASLFRLSRFAHEMHLLLDVVLQASLSVPEVYVERERSEISDARRVEISDLSRDQSKG